MNMKQRLRLVITILMVFVVAVSFLPVQQTHAATANKYLVLVKEYDGSYIMYDDMIYETRNKNLLIKAEPIAKALGMTYKAGNGKKKGCTITYGNDKLVFTRDSVYYVYYQGELALKRTAAFKQSYVKSYEMIHYNALRDLIRCGYYNSDLASEYKSFGYSGVIVYDYYSFSKPKLPKASEVFGTMVKPEISKTFNGSNMILASFSIKNGPSKLTLDLSKVIEAYENNNLLDDGVYGYGDCDGVVTIQGINSKGKSVGKIKTSGKEFMVDFPGAQQLIITGNVKNLVISFTPVKPIVITETTFLDTSEVEWISPNGKNAQQYFILPPYTQFNFFNYAVQTPYTPYVQNLEYGNTDPVDFSSGYQMMTLIFNRDVKEFSADTACGIEFRIVEKVINRSDVVVYDTKDNKQADNYETELLKMMEALKSVGLNKYFPSEALDKVLTIKIKEGIEYGGPDYISIQPGDTDLDGPDDYELHLHEMTHYYEQQIKGYGLWIRAWAEGNAVSLAKLVLDKMKIDYSGVYDQYNTDWSFLTESDKKDFENYYLTVEGWNAYMTGYHFNSYICEIYGDDVIYRILKREEKLNIPHDQGRKDERSKQFASCIKAETSNNVFMDFITEYVEK